MDCCLIVDRHHGLEERALNWSLGVGLGVPIFHDIICITRDKPLTFQASVSFVKEMQVGGIPLGLTPTYPCVCVCVLGCFSRVQLFATPWTAAHQAPLSIGFSRQEYWSGLPCPPPEDLPDPGISYMASRFFTPEPPGKPLLPT